MHTLIIVDDEEFILEQMTQAFRWTDMGFQLAGAFTGAEAALGYMAENPVDVLLTDIQLGGKSGLELAAEARKNNPRLEIVLLTAHSRFDYAHTALRLRVFEYLVKPVTFSGVTTCFETLRERLDSEKALRKAAQAPESTQDSGDESDYRIELVKRYIDKHIGDSLSLESLAETVSMNPAYFSRFFKRHTGVHFAEYLAERRMRRAIELLRDPHYKVFEICTLVGYYSKQNFYKRFRAFTGRTPADYRNEVLKIEGGDDE